MEVFVVMTAEIGANFEAFSWSAAAQALFTIEPRKLALLEGESTAPGSEVAYLMQAKSIFSAPETGSHAAELEINLRAHLVNIRA
jgi:hypothetical protein